MKARTNSTLLAVLIAFIAIPRFAAAQPLADRIPADAVVYVGWTGVDSMGPGFAQSNLKAMLDAAEVPKIVDEIIPQLVRRLGQEDQQAGQAADAAKDVLMPMWRHPTAVYIGPVDLTNVDQPKPRAAILCDAGEQAAALRRRLEEFVQQAGRNIPVPVAVRASGNVVALVIGETPALDEVFEGTQKAKALGAAKNFAAAMAMQKSPVLAAYVDVEALVKFVDEAVTKGDDQKAKTEWPKARDAIGLGGLKRASFAQGFDGKDWGTHVFLEAPKPRRGLLAGLEAEPVGDEMLRAIPLTATVAGVARLDAAGLFDGIRKLAGDLDPKAGEEFDANVKQLNDLLGLNVRTDVLEPLGDQWGYYIAPEVTGRGPLGVVVVNRLKDAAKAQAASDRLKELANAAIAAQTNDPNVRVQFKQAKVGGVTVNYLATPFVTPSWVIQNGNLYVGAYPQIAASAASHVSKEGKSILDNAAFTALRKRLGGERAVSFQFYDLPKSAPTAYQVWLMVSSFGKFGDVLGVDTPVNLLPPLSKLIEHLSVAGSVSWVDDAGWHFRSVTPFPGGTVLASETAGLMDMQSSAMLVSIILPSLNRAREQANNVKSMSNLRQIGQSVLLYANEHRGQFPDDLAATYEFVEDLGVYINPNGTNAKPQGLDAEARKRWINEDSDYVYVGKGKTSRAGADVIIAHEKPRPGAKGLNVLCADSHVEFITPMHVAEQMIEAGRVDHAAAGGAGKEGL